jgi:hypothetical protein
MRRDNNRRRYSGFGFGEVFLSGCRSKVYGDAVAGSIVKEIVDNVEGGSSVGGLLSSEITEIKTILGVTGNRDADIDAELWCFEENIQRDVEGLPRWTVRRWDNWVERASAVIKRADSHPVKYPIRDGEYFDPFEFRR